MKRIAYVTKWALTRGILKVTPTRIDDSGYLTFGEYSSFVGPGQWSFDLEIARLQVAKAKVSKINSYRKALAKLEALDINALEPVQLFR